MSNRKFLAYAVASTPLLFNYYVFTQKLLISDVVIMLCGALAIASGKKIIYLSIFFTISVFSLWALIYQLSLQLSPHPLSELSGLFLPSRILTYYFLAISVAFIFRDKLELKNAVVFIALLSAAYAFCQVLIYHVAGITLITGLPFLNQRFGLSIFENSAEIFEKFGYRPSSIFIEPAHLAQYCTIATLVLIGDIVHKVDGSASRYNIAKIAVLLTAPLAAGSSTAVLSVMFVLLVILGHTFSVIVARGVLNAKLLLFIFTVVVVIVFVFSLDLLAISRLSSGFSFGSIASETSAIFVRILRPFFYISDLIDRGEFFGLFFGYGFGAYESLIELSGLTTSYENSTQIYWVNTFGMLVSSLGLVGFSLFGLILWTITQHSSRNMRALVFYLTSAMFFSDMAASAYAFLIITLAISTKGSLKLPHGTD